MINVFTQLEVDSSSENEVSPEHRYFSNKENFLNQPAFRFPPLKFDADDKVSSVQNDSLHDIYAHSDYLLSYTATPSCQDSSAKMTKLIHDPIQSYSMIPHPN